MPKLILLLITLIIIGLLYPINSFDLEIILELRLPRVLLAVFAGILLSLSGLILQTIFKNPLAGPFTLGIASAVSFATSLAVALATISIFLNQYLMGISFGIVYAFFLYYLSRKTSHLILLLAGLIFSFFFSSLIVFTQYFLDQQNSFLVNRWMMGNLNVYSYADVSIITVVTLVFLFFAYYFRNKLDLLLLDEGLAHSAGLKKSQLISIFLLISTIILSILTTVCGPIGFIGLLVPNLIRLQGIHLHKELILRSALLGACALLFCDILAKNILFPFELPTGVMTSLIGAPLFAYVLVRNRQKE